MTEVLIDKRGEFSIIKIKGDVTPATGTSIEEAYRKVSGDAEKRIVFQFSRDNYINSGGIAVLIGIVSESRKQGQEIRITGLSEHFQKIFHMVGLAKYAKIYRNEEEAFKDS